MNGNIVVLRDIHRKEREPSLQRQVQLGLIETIEWEQWTYFWRDGCDEKRIIVEALDRAFPTNRKCLFRRLLTSLQDR
jgi:hypothetical protein